MTQTTLERCARALSESLDYGNTDLIFAATKHAGDCTKEPFTCSVCVQEELRTAAKAVINELMEPSEGALKSGELAWMNRTLRPDSEPLIDCYRAMLQAVLDGK